MPEFSITRGRIINLPRVILFFLLFVFSFLNASSALGSLEIYHLEGEAEARSPRREEWQKIEEEEIVPPDGELRVDSGAYLEVKDERGNNFRLNEQSGMKFNLENDADSIDLYYGSIEIELNPDLVPDFEDDFTVHTPVSTMGVRGTQFTTAYEMEQTNWTGVDRGAIWLEADTTIDLSEDEGADIEADTPGARPSLTRLGEIREELQVTWEHWSERKQVKRSEQMLAELNREISEIEEQLATDPPPRQQRRMRRNLQQLGSRKQQVETRLETARESYEAIQQRYVDFRAELIERREDFIEKRQEAFAEFIEEREEGLEELRERRRDFRRD